MLLINLGELSKPAEKRYIQGWNSKFKLWTQNVPGASRKVPDSLPFVKRTYAVLKARGTDGQHTNLNDRQDRKQHFNIVQAEMN